MIHPSLLVTPFGKRPIDLPLRAYITLVHQSLLDSLFGGRPGLLSHCAHAPSTALDLRIRLALCAGCASTGERSGCPLIFLRAGRASKEDQRPRSHRSVRSANDSEGNRRFYE